MAIQVITIAYRDKSMGVEAYVNGKFAVHAPDGAPLKEIKSGAWHTITHVATGRACATIQGRDLARRLAKRLDSLLPVDFDAADFTGEWSERYRSFYDVAMPILREARNAE